MADIYESMKLLRQLEYGNIPSKILHKNKGEYNFTFEGIYAYANPKAIDFDFIQVILVACKGDIKRASTMLYNDRKIRKEVVDFAKKEVWDKMRLDEVESQKIADEMFIFAFNTHWLTAAKVAQRIVGAKDDGFIGDKSLEILNNFDIDTFDMTYDEREEKHYETIVKKYPHLQGNIRGWKNRAYAV